MELFKREENTTAVDNGDMLTEQSSRNSSFMELTLAEERGLRTSFRSIGRDDEPPLQPRVHVYTVPRDSKLATPDSIISSGSVTIMNSVGSSKNLDASNLQHNYENTKSAGLCDTHSGSTVFNNGVLNSAAINKTESNTSKNFQFGNSMRTQLKSERDENWSISDFPSETKNFYERDAKKYEDTEENGISCCTKFVLFCLLLLVLVTGIGLLIYFKKEPASDRQIGHIITTELPNPLSKEICKDVMLNLRAPIIFRCNLETVDVTVTHIWVTPPIYWNEGRPFEIEVDKKSTDWRAEMDGSYRILTVHGKNVTCSTGGLFHLELYERNTSRLNTTVRIHVISEVLRVNVSLSQKQAENPNDFVLGCSTNSGCEQSSVDFLVEINNEEQSLRGVNFSCTVTYNDYDGYNVACIGTIPDFLLAKFEKITCRPKSAILDYVDVEEKSVEIELPKCDLTKHCGYTCKDNTDYYVVSKGRCDIFHRCYDSQVFTSYCAPGTFFDPGECACRHTRDLPWCQDNGALRPNSDVTNKICSGSDMST